jgi:hypothetical protein
MLTFYETIMVKSENLSLTFRKCPPKNLPSPGGRGFTLLIGDLLNNRAE